MNRFLTVTGADALDFLQGQLTQDVTRISRPISLPSAWCNPKGRVLASMRLTRFDDGFGMILPDDIGDVVLERLATYKFRAKVELRFADASWTALATQSRDDIALLQRLELLPLSGSSLTSRGVHVVRPDSAPDFVELYGTVPALEAIGVAIDKPLTDLAWRAARIQAGIPEIGATNSERFTPHMLNLDLLGAVSFSKGCYTGQEIVARTENLGRSRRRLFAYRAPHTRIQAGDKLSADNKIIGEVVNAAGGFLLAVVPLDLRDQILYAGDAALTALALPYRV